MTMTEVEGLLAVSRFETLCVRKRVPSPVAHRTKGDALAVLIDVGLHARHVDGRTEMTIANGERCQRVCFGDDGVVTKKNSLAIYRGC